MNADASLSQLLLTHVPYYIERVHPGGQPDDSYFSPVVTAQSGYSQEEWARRWPEQLYPEDKERVLAELALWRGGQDGDLDFRCLAKDGRTVWVRLQTRLVRHRADTYLLCLLSDTTVAHTHRQKLEAQLQQAAKLEALGRLAGSVAHDFNNLLTVINGCADMTIADLPADSVNHNDLAEIKTTVERARSLTRQLLAFSRAQTLQRRSQNLSDLVRGMSDMLRRLIGEHIELTFSLQADLPPVSMDAMQITQVLLNLTVNAADAMPTGGKLRVETSGVTLDESYQFDHYRIPAGAYALLSVSDTGMGMSDAVKAHLFEPFYTTKAPGKGTGLGLASVYGIVKQHDGHIYVYSEPGQGTVFKIYLPVSGTKTNADYPVKAAEKLPRGTEKVLLVEDEGGVRSVAARMLKRLGYLVQEASVPQQALEIAGADRAVDLLITDIVLPGMSGPDLYTRLKADNPRLKALFVSGYPQAQLAETTAAAFLPKPYGMAALAKALRAALNN